MDKKICRHEKVYMTQLASGMEKRPPVLLEPHTILPVQFFTHRQGERAWTREQCLMAAILEDAIGIYVKPAPPQTSKGRQVSLETRRWVHSNDRTWIFSFLCICEALNLDPNAIRRGLRICRGEEPPAPPRASSGGADVSQPADLSRGQRPGELGSELRALVGEFL
jgi:hypothetical protein